jgi:hypothetical protein
MAAPFDPQVGQGCAVGGDRGAAAVNRSETALTEAVEPAGDSSRALASCKSDIGSAICISSFDWCSIGIIA